MWPLMVVFVVEVVDEYLRFGDGVKLLKIEQVTPHGAVEPLNKWVLLWWSLFNEHSFDPSLLRPLNQRRGNELTSVVRANFTWLPVTLKQFLQVSYDPVRPDGS